MKNSAALLWIGVFLFAVLVFLTAPFIINHFKTDEHLKEYSTVIPFEATDSLGQKFNQQNLTGKVWVANFIFTSCPGQCPRLTQEMHKIYRSYDMEDKVRFVSFSVDPDRDTPEVLKAYMAQYTIDPKRWHFITAPLDEFQRVSVQGFKIAHDDNPLFHNERFVLVDQNMKVRGYYFATDADDVKKLFGDIAVLLKEGENDSVGK